MSVHWSSEIAKWEYRELQATAMSVDYTGNNVLLAGRRWLAIKQISLDEDAGDIVKKYPRQSKYDAAGAEWCQSYHGQKLCAIASNQRVDVYEWRGSNELTCITSLRGHTRVVSDTHFHRQDHNIIATCSIDTFTHLWDLRDARKPVISLCAVAGASQVQWNKVATHIVATAHDGDIKIWDYRKHSAPIHYISAHLCKIHGVDWSPHHEYQLVTSSHDGSIKYFDINNARRPENVIMTNFPVWRAIYTPFGSGLLTIGVGWGGLPRAEQAGVIGIWVGGALSHRLVGHTDTVQTMVWRGRAPHRHQLVTWGRDHTLRLWAMQPALLRMCSHYLPDDSDDDSSDATSSALLSAAGSVKELSINKNNEIEMNKIKSNATVAEEFESVRDLASAEITDINIECGTCQVHIERNGYIANLQVTFPRHVSGVTIPKFSWISGTNIETATTIKILQSINRVAHRKKKNGEKCLLPCVLKLAACVDEIPVKSSDDSDSMKSSQRSQSECENAGDSCIPFPKTCGAKWCGVSTLVVFNRPPNTRRLSLKHDTGTPRSLSSLSLGGLGGSGSAGGALPPSPLAPATPSPPGPPLPPLLHRHPSTSITTFYFQDRWKAVGRRAGSMRRAGSVSGCPSPRVLLYAAAPLFPLSRTLAERYLIDPDCPVDMCETNAKLAMEEGESELAHSWGLAALSARALSAQTVDHLMSSEESLGWVGHPLCCNLIQSLISHHARESDLQMAAMLSCVFAVFNANSSSGSQSTISSSSCGNGTSPYSTVNQYSETSTDGWTITGRSNSCSEADYLYTDSVASRSEPAACVLDPSTLHLYHCFKRAYADVLHRWQLLYKKTEVMKLVQCAHSPAPGGAGGAGALLVALCGCGAVSRGAVCGQCRRAALRCPVCGLGVRGLAAACALCCHAGHAHHMIQWFSERETCPTGCGCKCIIDGSTAWKGAKYV